jgi:hypothetical protein
MCYHIIVILILSDRKQAFDWLYNLLLLQKYNMKFLIALIAFASSHVAAFVPSSFGIAPRQASVQKVGGMSDDLGVPCEDECAIDRYEGLPDSIHPGVLSGQAMMDLLKVTIKNVVCLPLQDIPSLKIFYSSVVFEVSAEFRDEDL